MPDFIYCIYLNEDMGNVGPCYDGDILLLVCGRYKLLSKFKAGEYYFARCNSSKVT